MIPYQSREILGEFYYLIEKLMKKAQKLLRQKRNIEIIMKILETIGHQDFMNDFHCAPKCKQQACKLLCVRTKNEENLEKAIEKFAIFFDQNL